MGMETHRLDHTVLNISTEERSSRYKYSWAAVVTLREPDGHSLRIYDFGMTKEEAVDKLVGTIRRCYELNDGAALDEIQEIPVDWKM